MFDDDPIFAHDKSLNGLEKANELVKNGRFNNSIIYGFENLMFALFKRHLTLEGSNENAKITKNKCRSFLISWKLGRRKEFPLFRIPGLGGGSIIIPEIEPVNLKSFTHLPKH